MDRQLAEMLAEILPVGSSRSLGESLPAAGRRTLLARARERAREAEALVNSAGANLGRHGGAVCRLGWQSWRFGRHTSGRRALAG